MLYNTSKEFMPFILLGITHFQQLFLFHLNVIITQHIHTTASDETLIMSKEKKNIHSRNVCKAFTLIPQNVLGLHLNFLDIPLIQ